MGQSAGRSLKLWEQAELSGRHLAWEGAHVWQRIGNPVGCLDIRTWIRQRIGNPLRSGKRSGTECGHQTRLWPGVAEVRGTCPDYQSLDRALSPVEICGVMAKR